MRNECRFEASFTWDGLHYREHKTAVDNIRVLCGSASEYCWLRAAEATPNRIAFCDKYCSAVVTLPVRLFDGFNKLCRPKLKRSPI